MLKIKEIMCKKVIIAKDDISIQAAIQLLYERHVGSLIIVDDQEKCIGIFTERDAIRILAHKFPLNENLSKVMTRNVVTLSFEASFEEAKRLMLSHAIRHLPIIDQTGKLVGLFSLRAFFDEIMGLKTPKSNSV